MSRYVDVEKIQRLIIETGDKHSRNGEDIQTCGSICADLIIDVYGLPVDDVAEIKRGQWISQEYMNEIDSFIYTEYKCSNCGEISKKKSNYCPNCGARMVSKCVECEGGYCEEECLK